MAAKRLIPIFAILLIVGCGRREVTPNGDSDEVSAGDDGPECIENTDCVSGLCQNGTCWVAGGDNDNGERPCESDDACEAEEFCHYETDATATTGLCHPLCETSADCYFGQLCYELDGRCYTLRACDPTGSDCPPGDYCDPAVNACTHEPHDVIDWCRFERPLVIEAAHTQAFDVAGRVFKSGTTDRTTGLDHDSQLMAMVGYGPVDSSPVANPSWVWFAAFGNADFFDTDGGGTDEYVGTAIAPVVAGDYAMAIRFSGDTGLRWTYCDRDTGEPGEDGSEDGYQPENAGLLTAVPNPCSLNPCTLPDPPTCDADGYTRIVYEGPGTCTADGTTATCEYQSFENDCSEIGASCVDGECVGGAGPPSEQGQVIVTEIMPVTQMGDDMGEWIELRNVTDDPFNLEGCSLGDEDIDDHTITGILGIPAHSAILLAKSGDPYENHALPTPDYVYADFYLGNSNDEVVLACGGTMIDTVTYTSGFASVGVAAQLDPTLYDHVSNDERFNFCPAPNTYGASGMKGSPGENNPPCPPPDIAIDTCRVQAGLSVTAVTGEPFIAIGRVFNEGLTDLTHGIDEHPNLVAEAGYGPEETSPAANPGNWTWSAAAPNESWDAQNMNDLGFDEYRASYAAPAVGAYDHGFRFSLDSGVSWTYCDRDSLDPAYDTEDASRLLTVVNPCAGDPCPAISDCAGDGVTTLTAPAATCAIDGISAVCDYAFSNFDCSLLGGTCDAGVCVGSFRTPAVGEVIFTEVMHTPPVHLDLNKAQWLELTNTATEDVVLHDCQISTDAGSFQIFGGLLAAGDSFVMVRAASDNGGLTSDHVLSLSLGTADHLALTCGAETIDEVTYDDGVTFPGAQGVAMALSPGSSDAVANDDGANWCLSRASAPVGDHYGTPGSANLTCKNTIDRCRLDWPADLIDVEEGLPQAVHGRVEDAGITDVTTASDPHPALVGQVGYGPDGVDAADPTWVWIDAGVDPGWQAPVAPDPDALMDQYLGLLPAPAPGTYDVAFRFTLDGGRAWTLCDTDEGTYETANAGHLTTVESTGPNLLFSEYVEGSSTYKGLEIYNVGSNPAELSNCQVLIYFNGSSTPMTNLSLTAHLLAPDSVRMICHMGLTGAVSCDQSDNSIAFNGNDAVELTCGGVTMDIIGEIGANPGTEWGTAPTSTVNHTLRRHCSVTIGDRVGSDTFDPAQQWDGFPEDTFSGLGVRGCN